MPSAAEPRPRPATPRLPSVDYEGFADAIFALKKRTLAQLGEADLRHLRKIIWINRLCTLLGYATAWICPNPLSAYLISQGIFGRWLIMHHVSHEGYDKVPGVPPRYTSGRFARGLRRYVDWFDWIWPAAWHYEHDICHHFNTGETADPDLVEHHALPLRELDWPVWGKKLFVAFFACTWKVVYYAPNTLRAYDQEQRRKAGQDPDDAPAAGPDASPIGKLLAEVWKHGLDLRRPTVRRLWLLCYLPYATVAFVLIPLVFLPLGLWAVGSVLANRLLAELMTNFHAFLVIGPNHSGDDLYRFDRHFKGRAEFAVHQVAASVNYHTGTELIDYLQIWLNYQIEHHLFPKLPMRQYRLIQPEVKALCETYGVPYVQESLFRRFAQLVGVMVGHRTMRRLPDPEEAVGEDALPAA